MVLIAFLTIVLFSVLMAVPLAYFGMLFLGNLGLHLGFWAVLPGAVALRIFGSSVTAK